MIVVDTNIVAYLLIDGPHTKRAEALRVRDSEWCVPSLFRHEWLNVVNFYVRGQRFDRDKALRVYKRGLSLVRVDEAFPDPARIINLSLASKCSSYDCQFVATAEKLGVPLVTVDKELTDYFTSVAEVLA